MGTANGAAQNVTGYACKRGKRKHLLAIRERAELNGLKNGRWTRSMTLDRTLASYPRPDEYAPTAVSSL